MIDFYRLFELAQIKAIHSALEPSLESLWRIKCRDYATRFHTPLHVVMNELDPNLVLQALYEERYPPSIVEEELEALLEMLRSIKDPTYTSISKEDLEAMVDTALNREVARLEKKKNKVPTQKSIEAEIKEAETNVLQKPKSGGMSFESLESLETKAEANKAGFNES